LLKEQQKYIQRNISLKQEIQRKRQQIEELESSSDEDIDFL